jgi:uncharacterized protein
VAWLLREGQVLASTEVVSGPFARWRALSGRSRVEGAVLVRPARSTHTFGSGGPVDVVFCDAALAVVEVVAGVASGRVLRPRPKARAVVGAEAGWVERHRIKVGDQLELRG